MNRNLHIPFDIFGMRDEVTVSALVRNGGLGWTCGQCPLDTTGKVVAPNDLGAQAAFVCEMIEGLVPRAGFDPAMIGKLNVYFAEVTPGDGADALSLIRGRFPTAIVVPIRVPHFYYEGMLLEVDVFAGTGASRRPDVPGLQIVDTDAMSWALIDCAWGRNDPLGVPLSRIEALLGAQGLVAENLIDDQWQLFGFADEARDQMGDLGQCPFVARPEGCMVAERGGARAIAAAFSFSRQPVKTTELAAPDTLERLTIRDDGTYLTIHGVQADPAADLVDQTGGIMAGIARALATKGLTFGHVVKVTGQYVGGATPEELHGNMKVRHKYYAPPGPASTGLPINGLLDPACRISISVVAAR